MDKNSTDFSKYIVTLEEYEEFCFEYIGMFGLICYGNLDDESIGSVGEYSHCSRGPIIEFTSSPAYKKWLSRYSDEYLEHTYSDEKYAVRFRDGPETDNIYRPIYISVPESEQIVSILTTVLITSMYNSNYPFMSSLGVKFLKETYFTYYHDDGTWSFPSNGTYRCFLFSKSNCALKKWDKEKLFMTYSYWLSWIGSAIRGYRDFIPDSKPKLDPNFDLFFSTLGIFNISLHKLHFFRLAVLLSSISQAHHGEGPGIYFTPKISLFLIEDLKLILEKYIDPNEESSKVEVREFIIGVCKKLYKSGSAEDGGEGWASQNLRGYYLVYIFRVAKEYYPSDSVFHTKLWVKDFKGGYYGSDDYNFFEAKDNSN